MTNILTTVLGVVFPRLPRNPWHLLNIIAFADTGEIHSATWHWMGHNHQARREPCRCGAPVTHVRYDNRNIGLVPVEHWTCHTCYQT